MYPKNSQRKFADFTTLYHRVWSNSLSTYRRYWSNGRSERQRDDALSHGASKKELRALAPWPKQET